MAEQKIKEEGPGNPGEKSPLWIIAALFLLFVIIAAVVPVFLIKYSPRPRNIPAPDALGLKFLIVANKNASTGSLNSFLAPDDPVVKAAATKIAADSCPSNKECHARAQFGFVRDNFEYVAESDEYIMLPSEMLYARGGDCDDHAVLLASLLRAVGIPTRFVHVPGHVYVSAYIGRQGRDGWVSLDATCKSCEFGEIMPKYIDSEKTYS